MAILNIPSLSVLAIESESLAKGINTVDSFDIHSEVLSIQDNLVRLMLLKLKILMDMKSSSHCVDIQRIGMSSDVNNQRIGFKMTK